MARVPSHYLDTLRVGDNDKRVACVMLHRVCFAVCLVLAFFTIAVRQGAAEPVGADELPATLAVKVRSIQKGLSEIRGHEYHHAVRARTMDEREVREFLLQKLAHEYPDEKLALEQIAWVHFGFLDAEDDLKELFVGMLTQQAAGFYDPDDGRLIVLTGKAFPGLALVHELAHALADQIFGLKALLNSSRMNDDLLMAVSAMVEGEAQALSTSYVHSPKGAGLLDEDTIAPGGSSTAAPGEPRSVPPMLQHSFTFPYTQGMLWAAEVVRKRGQTGMDAFYREPPDSTEQIMHPEKSAEPRDRPSVIHEDLLGLPEGVLRDAGYEPVKRNVLGEFGIRELFGGSTDSRAGLAAAGWDGDLFSVLRGPGGRTGMIWITVWDSAAEADEFLDSATKWLAWRHQDEKGYRVVRCASDGRLVLLIEGFASDLTDRIEAALAPAIAGKVTMR